MNKLVNPAWFAVFSILLAGAWTVLPASRVEAKDAPSSTFEAKCAVCHGKDGSGNTPIGKSLQAPDLRSKPVQAQSNKQLDDFIAKGKSPMPAFGGQLSKEDIEGLVAYLRAIAKKK